MLKTIPSIIPSNLYKPVQNVFKAFKNIENRSGDTFAPCRTPVIKKSFESTPFKATQYLADLYIFNITRQFFPTYYNLAFYATIFF